VNFWQNARRPRIGGSLAPRSALQPKACYHHEAIRISTLNRLHSFSNFNSTSGIAPSVLSVVCGLQDQMSRRKGNQIQWGTPRIALFSRITNAGKAVKGSFRSRTTPSRSSVSLVVVRNFACGRTSYHASHDIFGSLLRGVQRNLHICFL
jgi:hypothetical protein